ncbi:MAG: PEP-CTERM sorting domain-containing protein [Rubrivivax sp.]
MLKTLLATVAVVAPLALPAHAVTVVQWDFENAPADLNNATVSPAVAASVGTGTASGVHASSASDWTTPTGNGSANSLSSNTWATGDYYQFAFSTATYGDLVLSFDQTRSSTGPSAFTLAYSVNGGSSFVDFTTYTVLENVTPSWSASVYSSKYTFSFDLSGVTALDNQASVLVRLVSNVTPSNASGTNRVDNFSVMLSPVPEPGTTALLLAGLASLGFVARRRRG